MIFSSDIFNSSLTHPNSLVTSSRLNLHYLTTTALYTNSSTQHPNIISLSAFRFLTTLPLHKLRVKWSIIYSSKVIILNSVLCISIWVVVSISSIGSGGWGERNADALSEVGGMNRKFYGLQSSMKFQCKSGLFSAGESNSIITKFGGRPYVEILFISFIKNYATAFL